MWFSQQNSSRLKKLGFYLVMYIFIISFTSKIMNIDKLIKTTTVKNMPYPIVSAFGALVLLLFGITMSILGENKLIKRKYGQVGIDMLILFTIVATYYFHNIYVDPSQKYHFEKNIAIVGGLLIIRDIL